MSRKPGKVLQLLPDADVTTVPSKRNADYQPFPVAALPTVVGQFASGVARALGCDEACVALPALAAMASAIGRTRVIQLKQGWEEPCVVWSAVVGYAGTLKSHACRRAVRPLLQLQKPLLLEYRAKSTAYKRAVLARMRAIQLTETQSRDPGELPDRPVLQRLICDSTSVETMAEILEDSRYGTLVVRHDLNDWLASFTRLPGKNGGRDLTAWLDMHAGGSLFVDRGKRRGRQFFVPSAAISLTGSLRPGTLVRALKPDVAAAGLVSRLLLAMPPSLPRVWSESVVEIVVEQDYDDTILSLHALNFDTSDGRMRPHVLTLEPEAKACWITFHDSCERERTAADAYLAAAVSKMPGYVA
jgi:hypothetical protein